MYYRVTAGRDISCLQYCLCFLSLIYYLTHTKSWYCNRLLAYCSLVHLIIVIVHISLRAEKTYNTKPIYSTKFPVLIYMTDCCPLIHESFVQIQHMAIKAENNWWVFDVINMPYLYGFIHRFYRHDSTFEGMTVRMVESWVEHGIMLNIPNVQLTSADMAYSPLGTKCNHQLVWENQKDTHFQQWHTIKKNKRISMGYYRARVKLL